MSTEPTRKPASKPTQPAGAAPVKPAAPRTAPAPASTAPTSAAPASGGKGGKIAMLVMLILLAAGLGTSGWLAYSAKSELAEAESKIKQVELARSGERKELNKTIAKFEAAQEEATNNDILFDFVADALMADREAGKDAAKLTVRDALDRATERLDAGEFKKRPDLELQLRRTIGYAYLRLGVFEPAEAHFRRAYDLTRELAGGDDRPEMLEGISGLALVLAAKGDAEEATPLLTRAMEMYNKFLQDQPPGRVNNLTAMMQNAMANGNYLEAASHANYIVLVLERQFGKAHPLAILARMSVARNLQAGSELTLAESMAREVVNRLERILPGVHPHISDAMALLAGILNDNGKHKEAESYARHCLKIREAILPKTHWQRFSAMCIVGEALAGQKKYPEAEKMLLRGYKGLIAKKSDAPMRRKREACEALAKLYEAMEQPENVEKYQKLVNKYTEKRRSAERDATGAERG